MRAGSHGRLGFAGLVLALGLVAAACNNDPEATPGAGSDLSLQIAGPSDGDSVEMPFELKVDSSVDLGEPDTGSHHVHLCFDGASCDTGSEYVIGDSDTIEVADLTPGEHTIEASLRNADHSAAGISDTITVTVGASGGGTDSGSPTSSPSRSYDY